MKLKAINGRWVIWTTDAIADWDGLTGDPSIPSGWEWERLDSMQRNLRYGDSFFDVGAEHGALSAVIAREFVGPQNMVLIEPSARMWGSIIRHWRYNGLADPMACWHGFAGSPSPDAPIPEVGSGWPEAADLALPEVGGMPYASLVHPGVVPTISIDDLADRIGVQPDALNIDVEGAEEVVLQGAVGVLEAGFVVNVWVSIHPDLMARDFGSSPAAVIGLMSSLGYKGEHLATDHEEHWWFHR